MSWVLPGSLLSGTRWPKHLPLYLPCWRTFFLLERCTGKANEPGSSSFLGNKQANKPNSISDSDSPWSTEQSWKGGVQKQMSPLWRSVYLRLCSSKYLGMNSGTKPQARPRLVLDGGHALLCQYYGFFPDCLTTSLLNG